MIYTIVRKINSISQKILNFKNKTDLKDYVRLKKLRRKEIKLHFGCGARILRGWINIDIIYEPNYGDYDYGKKFYGDEIRGNKNDFYKINIFENGLPLDDNSVDVIFHEDFIEHLSQKEQYLFLAEAFRVQKPGSLHRINTPNLFTSLVHNSNFTKGLKGVYSDEWDRWQHKSVLTPKTIVEMAEIVGYSKIILSKRDSSISRLIPFEYRPGSDRLKKEGNIFVDLIK